jgi:hypothetical protein
MADVDTPTCRAIPAMVVHSLRPICAKSLPDGRYLTRRLSLRNSVRRKLYVFCILLNQALNLPAGQQLQNCTVGSCNHTFVADSFEKRDDFYIAMTRTILQARIKDRPWLVSIKVDISTLAD